jgi:hypothetical protein
VQQLRAKNIKLQERYKQENNRRQKAEQMLTYLGHDDNVEKEGTW